MKTQQSRQQRGLRDPVLFGIAVLMGVGLSWVRGAIAQSVEPCQPPASGEYLLLVIHQSTDTQTQLAQTLPPNVTTTVCDYLGNTVSRIGGFSDREIANSWADYLSEISGFQAFVALPSDAAPLTPSPDPAPTETADALQPQPAPSPSVAAVPSPSPAVTPPTPTATPSPQVGTPSTTGTYNPQPLGTGYAVLVDYGNRPQVAAELSQVIEGSVGLVSYQQRPYLLASYTPDLTIAASVMRQLGDRNFVAIIVDSRQAVLLTSAVAQD